MTSVFLYGTVVTLCSFGLYEFGYSQGYNHGYKLGRRFAVNECSTIIKNKSNILNIAWDDVDDIMKSINEFGSNYLENECDESLKL